jgi:3,4-dihydroxy-2-butanone 4-phosphate synthase
MADRKRSPKSPFAPISEAIDAIRDGRMIIVVDDEDRENEGDLTVAAEKVTPEIINFMARHGRGLICMPMTEERLAELDLPQMVPDNTARFNTAFCVSVEAKHVTSTGISAADRAATVLAAIDPRTRPADLARPGHMFPLKARNGGVLLYLNQEGRGIGLANKIRAYELQDQGLDTVEANERLGFKADQRDYGIGVQILKDLGVKSMRLLSNNPRKLVGLEGYGLSVAEWLPLEIPASEFTRRYLTTKKQKLGHKLRSV